MDDPEMLREVTDDESNADRARQQGAGEIIVLRMSSAASSKARIGTHFCALIHLYQIRI
jgi:hypothetical protein